MSVTNQDPSALKSITTTSIPSTTPTPSDGHKPLGVAKILDQLDTSNSMTAEQVSKTVQSPSPIDDHLLGTAKPIKQTDQSVLNMAKQVSGTVQPVVSATATPASLSRPPVMTEKALITKAVESNLPKDLAALLTSLLTSRRQKTTLDDNLQKLLTNLLIFAASKGYWESARILIDNGADITVCSIRQETILMHAVIKGDIGFINFLIEKVNQIDPKHKLLTQLLNARDKNGNTAFIYAAMWGQTSTVSALIQALIDADINPNDYLNVQNNIGQTPLMIASIYGHTETVRLLLTKVGVDLKVRDHSGDTALMLAAQCGRWEIIQMLHRYDANFSDIHQVLADEVARALTDDLTEQAKALIAHGASLKTAQTILEIKTQAHIWGLAGLFTVQDEIGGKTTFKLEGMRYGRHMLPMLNKYVERFYETNFFKSNASSKLELLKSKQLEIQTSIANALHADSLSTDIDHRIEKFKKEYQPLVLLGGSKSHAISMVICHTKTKDGIDLLISNRGLGMMGFYGVTRYRLCDASHVNEKMIKKLTTKTYGNMKEFNEMISEMLAPLDPSDPSALLKDQPDRPLIYKGGFTQTPQKGGFCAWTSCIKAVLIMLWRAYTEELKDPRWGDVAYERQVNGKAVSKRFTAWTHEEVLENLINSDSNLPNKRLILPIMKKYIEKLFGQYSIPDKESMLELIKKLESPEIAPEERRAAISALIPMLEQYGRGAERSYMPKVGRLLENWLKDQMDGV